MKQWEYKVTYVKPRDLEITLSRQGREGWELATSDFGVTHITLIFKREKDTNVWNQT